MSSRSRKRRSDRNLLESSSSVAKKAKPSPKASKMAEPESSEPGIEEDPVAFLQRMRKNCPNILSVLNTKQAKLLAKSPKAPYGKDADEEYLTDMAACVGVKSKIDNAKSTLRSHLLTPQLTKEEVDVENFEKQTAVLQKVRVGGSGACRHISLDPSPVSFFRKRAYVPLAFPFPFPHCFFRTAPTPHSPPTHTLFFMHFYMGPLDCL